MMSERCSNRHCDAPEVACNLGEEPYTSCPDWKKATPGEDDPVGSVATEDDVLLLPWTSNSLGILDLEFVAARSQQTLVGVVGPHNAGKTTFLTMIYLLLSQGKGLTAGTFAGSYSLEGWENLAYYLRWQSNYGPTFPPHTSRTTGRRPGLLHFAIRDKHDELRDILYADAPGEWFERWSIDKTAPDAEGARWVHSHSDAFILVADSDALSGPERGKARGILLEMARRLSDGLVGRKVLVVWTKADKQVPGGIQNTLRSQFATLFPNYEEFEVQVQGVGETAEVNKISFLKLLDKTLTGKQPMGMGVTLPVVEDGDPFLAFRGKMT